jgi:septal ring factor EnvC (AmiA/AmiB activator)
MNGTKQQELARVLAMDTDELVELLATLRHQLAAERERTARLQARVAEQSCEIERLRAEVLSTIPRRGRR